MKHSNNESSSTSTSKSSLWSSWFQRSKPTPNTTSIPPSTLPNITDVQNSTGGGCPVKHSSSSQPQSREEAAKYVQTPHPDQTIPLSTVRSISSIPRGSLQNEEKGPHHQPSSSSLSSSSQTQGQGQTQGQQGCDSTNLNSTPKSVVHHLNVDKACLNCFIDVP